MTNTEFKTGVISPIDCVKEGFELIKKDYWLLFAIGLVGGLMVGVFADPHMILYKGFGGASDLPGKAGIVHGSWTLLRWQAETAGFVIIFSGIMTFIILKLIGIFVPLRLSDEELEIGDHAIHGNEVYPSDVPTLGGPHAPGWQTGTAMPAGAGAGA